MPTTATNYRYQFAKGAKEDCPQCGPKHRRTFSRYVDSRTGEVLPEEFGRCDRESNCGYHVSPYHSGPSGKSYADEVFEHWKTANSLAPDYTRQLNRYAHDLPVCEAVEQPIYAIPAGVFQKTLGHYDSNQFATLLRDHFGQQKANGLLERFQIGTSSYWPGASVFWLIDLEGRARCGQVNLFTDDWHRDKFTNKEGIIKPCISSVSHGLLRHYKRNGEDVPNWLQDYHDKAPRWPIPFGLHQLRTEPTDKPVAIVEACKTAVVCAGYFPEFIWLAIGAKSYPNAERLACLRDRSLILYPDLNAYTDWSKRADTLRAEGFTVNVSTLLEDHATDDQRQQGLDLADFLLQPTPAPNIVTTLAEWAPGTILRPDESALIRL